MSDDPIDLSKLRTPVPLNAHDYAAVRARVMSEIAQREHRGWIRFLVPMAAIIALFVLFIPREEPVAMRPVAAPAPVQKPVIAVRPDRPRVPELASLPVEETPKPVRRRRSTKAGQTRLSVLQHHVEQPMRIEIHTADPDVRIIWIVSSAADAETKSLKEKS